MQLKYRRLLYIAFFIIFFIAAPIIVFLAQGYRYNFTKGTVEKTGVLFLESKPEDVNIYLNNKLQKTGRVDRIKALLPNEYEIKVAKPDYQTWQKKITIQPGQTTFVQYIRLFKEQPEITNLLDKNIILTSQKVNDTLVLIYLENNKNTLALFNFSNSELTDLIDLNYQPQTLTLSPKQNYILLDYPTNYAKSQWVFDIRNKTLIDLKETVIERVTNLTWPANSDNELFYLSHSRGFEKINLADQEKTLLSSKTILDFYINDDSFLTGENIYYLEKDEKNILLNKSNLNNLKKFETLTTLPISNNYQFIKYSPDNILTLLDNNNQLLYLINIKEKNEDNKMLIFSKANFANWSGEMLLFGNNYELISYDLQKQEKIQIARLGEKITQAEWYPVVTHVIFSTYNNLKIIENVEQDRVLNTLFNKNILKIFPTHETDKIYYLDKTGLNVVQIQ